MRRVATKALAVLGVGAVTATMAVASLAPTAAIADTGGWDRHAGGETSGASGSGNRFWIGNFRSSNGTIGYCALQGARFGPGSPAGGSMAATVYDDPVAVTTLTNLSNNNGASIPNVSGTPLGDIAWIMSEYGRTNSRLEAVAAELAIMRLGGAGVSWTVAEATGIAPGAETRAQQMIAEAAAHRGAYTVDPSITLANGGRTGTVTGVGVRQGGSWLAGYPYTATLTGPAQFSNGSATISGTTNSSAISLPTLVTHHRHQRPHVGTAMTRTHRGHEQPPRHARRVRQLAPQEAHR